MKFEYLRYFWFFFRLSLEKVAHKIENQLFLREIQWNFFTVYLVVAMVVGRVVAAVVAALVVAAAGRLDPSEPITVWVGANTVYFCWYQ